MPADQILDLKKIEGSLIKLFSDRLEGQSFCKKLYSTKQVPYFTGWFSTRELPDVQFSDQIPSGLFPDDAFGGREARLQFVDFLTKFETEIKEESISIYKKIAGSEQQSLFAVLRAQQAENEDLSRKNLDLTELDQRIMELVAERDALEEHVVSLETKLQQLSSPSESNFNWQKILKSKQKRLTDRATVTLEQIKEQLDLAETGLAEAAEECRSLCGKLVAAESQTKVLEIENRTQRKQLDANAKLYETYQQKFDSMVERVKQSEFHYIQLNKVKTKLELDLDTEQKKSVLLEQQFKDYRETIENMENLYSKIQFRWPLNPFFYLKWGFICIVVVLVLTIIRWLTSFFRPRRNYY